MRRKYIIEARGEDGQLKFDCLQPCIVFGLSAVHGMSADDMAKIIFRHVSNAMLDGSNIPKWPALLHPNWKARVKTW